MKNSLCLALFICYISSINAQSVVLQGYPNENKHVLEWVVTECSYVNHFEIERSIDGSRFEVVYTKEIRSYECNGNYSYTFYEFPKGYQYEYRVKAYLNTTLPILSGITTIFYQPNDIEIINFTLHNNQIQFSTIARQKNMLIFTITDIFGKVYYKNTTAITIGKQDIQWQINIPSTGIYFIQIADIESRPIYQNKYFLKNN